MVEMAGIVMTKIAGRLRREIRRENEGEGPGKQVSDTTSALQSSDHKLTDLSHVIE